MGRGKKGVSQPMAKNARGKLVPVSKKTTKVVEERNSSFHNMFDDVFVRKIVVPPVAIDKLQEIRGNLEKLVQLVRLSYQIISSDKNVGTDIIDWMNEDTSENYIGVNKEIDVFVETIKSFWDKFAGTAWEYNTCPLPKLYTVVISDKITDKFIVEIHDEIFTNTLIIDILEDFKTLKDHIPIINNVNLESVKRIHENIPMVYIKSIPSLDFRKVWSVIGTPTTLKKTIKSIIYKIYKIYENIVEIYYTVPMHPRDMGEVIIGALANLKITIPGCDLAFEVLNGSLSMLTDNMPKYYRNAVESDNSSLIIIDFIADIQNDKSSLSPAVIHQFRKIGGYVQHKIENDPQLKKKVTEDSGLYKLFQNVRNANKEE